MSKIPTAKEFAESNQYDLESYDEGGYLGIDTKVFAEKLIEFARLHVKAALEAAAEVASNSDLNVGQIQNILNAYPLNLNL